MSQRPPALDAPWTLSPRDIALLLASTAGRRHAARDRCLLLLMFRHGLRVSEACRLTLAHVDVPHRVLHVMRLQHGLTTTQPLRADELQAIGRTNDAILYGGRVIIWVRAADELLAEVGPKIPSSASPDHGAPFSEIFKRAGGDFYKIDPLLFSPAEIVFHNLVSGKSHFFGRTEPEVLKRSFFAHE